ncbi:MAG: hypothetical protein IIB44_12705, partial [Candidatus Marinimicrobia bacterium]|nr:hypothetical protein [Candidatus Neomarinimicrobiota bacterium]
MVVDGTQSNVGYAIDDGGSLYKMTGATFTTIASLRDNGTSGATRGEDLLMYQVNGVDKLLYFYEDDGGLYSLDDVTFNDTFLSGTTAGKAQLQNAPHPAVIFPDNNRAYIGNGQYLAEFNGNTSGGSNGTLDATKIDLGPGWEITSLFIMTNFTGMCAWQKNQDKSQRTQSAVFLWDGVSDKPNKSIPVEDNKIEASINKNGTIFLLTQGRQSASALRRLTDNGAALIRNFRFDIAGTTVDFTASKGSISYRKILDVFNNQLLQVYTDNNSTYIAKIKNGKIVPIQNLGKKYSIFNWYNSYRGNNLNNYSRFLKFKEDNNTYGFI